MVIASEEQITKILARVHDPEIPVLSIIDMGIIRKIEHKKSEYQISITPTYSGCPAMDAIGDDIIAALKQENITASVKLVLSPAWTTDFLTEKGKKDLENYGIAVPLEATADLAALSGKTSVLACTRCGSKNTQLLSRFGSTACKALFKCNDCHEPFDYLKCLK